MKKILLGLSIFMMFIGCQKEKSAEAPKEKVYIVGTNAEYPPFEYIEDEKIKGLDPDIIEEIFKRLGYKYEWANTTFDGLIPALQTNKIDIVIAGMSITEARAKAVNFTEPYLVSKVAFLENKKNTLGGIENLVGKTFGAQIGTTKEASAKKIKDAKVIPYSGNTAALIALKSSKVDAIVVDESVAENYLNSNPDLALVGYQEGEPKAIAIGKENKKLLEEINKTLVEMLNDGTIEKLRKKYGV